MKKLLSITVPVLLFSLLIMSTSTASISTVAEVEPGDMVLDKREFKNKDYAWFVARLPVENKGKHSGMVHVNLKVIDKHAYERDNIRLSGHVGSGEKATLTLLSNMDYKLFDSIRTFEISSIEIH